MSARSAAIDLGFCWCGHRAVNFCRGCGARLCAACTMVVEGHETRWNCCWRCAPRIAKDLRKGVRAEANARRRL